MSATANGKPRLTPAQQYLNDLWDEHIRDEFSDKDAISTIDTMVPDAYVNQHSGTDWRRRKRTTEGILFEALHSKDASGHGNRANLAHDW